MIICYRCVKDGHKSYECPEADEAGITVLNHGHEEDEDPDNEGFIFVNTAMILPEPHIVSGDLTLLCSIKTPKPLRHSRT